GAVDSRGRIRGLGAGVGSGGWFRRCAGGVRQRGQSGADADLEVEEGHELGQSDDPALVPAGLEQQRQVPGPDVARVEDERPGAFSPASAADSKIPYGPGTPVPVSGTDAATASSRSSAIAQEAEMSSSRSRSR